MDLLNSTLINLTLLSISFFNETASRDKQELSTRREYLYPENFNFTQILNSLKNEQVHENISFNHATETASWYRESHKNSFSSRKKENRFNFTAKKSSIFNSLTETFLNATKRMKMMSEEELISHVLTKVNESKYASSKTFGDRIDILSPTSAIGKDKYTMSISFSFFLIGLYVQHLMMTSFSAFYLGKLQEESIWTSDKQMSYVFSNKQLYANETTPVLNPCHTYVSYIRSSSRLLRYLKYYVNPTLATLGLCQNIMCVVVLKKDGFSKTSNLNLLSVILAGSFQQLLSINIAEIVEIVLGVATYEEVTSYICIKKKNLVLQVFKHINILLGTWGQYVISSTFLLITIERFLAVFLPLTFKKYVNKKSIVSSLCIIFLIWLPFALYKISCLFNFEILITLRTNSSKSEMFWLEFFYKYSTIFALTIFVLSKCIPVPLALVGSVVIGIRIKIILNKRSKLTNVPQSMTWSNQTTKVLLVTCLLFCISDSLQYILSYIAVFHLKDLDIGFLLHSEFISFSFLLTSCNTFFVFISTNRRLLGHFKQLIQSLHLKFKFIAMNFK